MYQVISRSGPDHESWYPIDADLNSQALSFRNSSDRRGGKVLVRYQPGRKLVWSISKLRGDVRQHHGIGGVAALDVAGRLSVELPLTLRGLVGWRHAYGDVVPQSLLALAGGASLFTVTGTPLDRYALVAEAGLDWQASEALSLVVAYAGEIGERVQEHSIKGHLT